MGDKATAARRPKATGSAENLSDSTRSLDELWLDCQQRLVSHVAHDLKGALNSVSVNLEVVRGRAGRPDTPASDVARYADAAAGQLGVVIGMTAALLSVGRAVRGPAEVSVIVRQLVALLESTIASDGAKIELLVEGGLAGTTAAPAAAVRLALTEALLSAATQKRDVAVRVRAGSAPKVEIRTEGSVVILPDTGRALAGAGISIKTDGHGISISFPAPPDTPTEEA